MRLRWLASHLASLTAVLLALVPAPARAQIFLASRPDPPFTIGPLMIRARIDEGSSAVNVHVLWSLVVPGSVRPEDVAQDLYLMWPGELAEDEGPGKPDPALTRYVEGRGFSVIGEGRLRLLDRSLAEGKASARAPAGGAPFVIFVQTGGALGLSPPATLVRIPWSPRATDSGWLMDLRMKVKGLVKPRKATWAERLFVGGRYRVTVSYNEVRDRPLFPMYLAHRDRVIRLADAPAELAVSFTHSDRLKIYEVFPPTAVRRTSDSEERTEVVSLFIDKTDGITPQHLALQFGYYSKLQGWALILIPAAFFALGQAIGPAVGRTAMRFGAAASARVHLSRRDRSPPPRETGVILSRDVLAKIAPGATTRDEVIKLCGTEAEQFEQFPASERRTLVYRGRRLVPKTRRVFGWLSTIDHWEAERHEVTITFTRDVVSDVQAQTRVSRVTTQDADQS